MTPTTLRSPRAPLIPLGALFLVGYLNVMNRCADGWCYTYGWPWVAYYRWSDGGGSTMGGVPTHPRLEWLPAFGNLAIGAIILIFALAAHRRMARTGG